MKIQRTLPPAAALIGINSLLHGLMGCVLGKKYLKRFEEELRTYFGVKHVFLLSSGKASLTIILKALKSLAPEKDQVLIPAYTCFSVPSAIVKAGLKVSLCDINMATFDFDYSSLEKSICEKTLCVVPNHLFGIPADMDRIMTLCRLKGTFVIEDAAQAMGGDYQDKQLGTLGDVGFYSLGRGKNLTCGAGGIVITNSDSIARKITEEYEYIKNPSQMENLKELLNAVLLALFIRPSLYWAPAGLPFLRLGETFFYYNFPIKRFSGMQAGLLKNWQARLSKSNLIRKITAHWFIDALCLIKYCNNISYLRLPILALDHESREKILLFSKREGLGMSAMYPIPIHEIEELKEQFKGVNFPIAKEVSQRILTIPTHQLLTQSDKERIVALMNLHADELATLRGHELVHSV